MTERDMVKAFHKKMGQPVADRPTIPSEEQRRLRAQLVLEEALELVDALGFDVAAASIGGRRVVSLPPNSRESLERIAQENADLRYVCHGNDVVTGVPPDVFAEVHRANMEKVPGATPTEKIRKPKGWRPPDVRMALCVRGHSIQCFDASCAVCREGEPC